MGESLHTMSVRKYQSSYTPTPIFKTAIHEIWYTTKHENSYPFCPQPYFQARPPRAIDPTTRE
jgi:hypothetical protein